MPLVMDLACLKTITYRAIKTTGTLIVIICPIFAAEEKMGAAQQPGSFFQFGWAVFVTPFLLPISFLRDFYQYWATQWRSAAQSTCTRVAIAYFKVYIPS
jgi:hypothetical protein